MHADPAYNTSYQPYLDTLPAADEVLGPEMWTRNMVAALQTPELVRTCRHLATKEAPSAAPRLPVSTIPMQIIMASGQRDGEISKQAPASTDTGTGTGVGQAVTPGGMMTAGTAGGGPSCRCGAVVAGLGIC